MTRDDRLKAFQMRIDGSSWEQIGRTLGYAGTTVRQDLLASMAVPRRVNCVYPAIRSIIVTQYGGSVSAFADAADSVSKSCIYAVLSGQRPPNVRVIEAVLNVTGLSYEAAFRREAD